MNRFGLLFALLALSHSCWGALFDSDVALNLTIEADFTKLEKQRDKNAEYPGNLTISGVTLPIALKVRGNSRLKKNKCHHAPLRIDFKKSDNRKDTVFDKQDDIKLVVVCRDRTPYRVYLRKEFLAYQILLEVTDLAYRVRWAEITYVDEAKQKTKVRPGFFIEKKKHVAKRNQLTPHPETRGNRYVDLDADHAALLDHFQFLIGNTDYSVVTSDDPEDCCHNAKLLKDDNEVLTPIIYDFDSTGFVNPSYAEVNPNVAIDNVRERAYRGYCFADEHLQKARQTLLEKESVVLALVQEDSLLAKRDRRRAVKYLQDGYRTMKEDRRYRNEILRECRG